MFSVVEFINSEKVALKLVLRSRTPLLLKLIALRLVTLGEVVSTEKVRSAGVVSPAHVYYRYAQISAVGREN